MSKDAYEIVGAIAEVKRFSASVRWTADFIDYENHKAYKPSMENSTVALRLKAFLQFCRSVVLLILKRAIRYEMIPVEIRKPKNIGGCFHFLQLAIRNIVGLKYRGDLELPPSTIFENMAQDGCCVVRIPEYRFSELDKAARPHFNSLEVRRATRLEGQRKFEESRGSVDTRDDGDELHHLINQILVDSGILDAASLYLGRKAKLIDVNPQINDSTDSFWRNIFPDIAQMQIPEAAYFHRDASGGDLKAIFYMTDVGPSNGPFTYVVGSNKLAISKFHNFVAEANDHNGLSATTPEARERFMALPKKLRHKGSFGNDLHDDSKMAREIREGQWSIQSNKGAIVLFDTKGVHRGGMVDEGERYVITVVIG